MTWCNDDDSSEEKSIQRVISTPPSPSTKDKNKNNITSETQDDAAAAAAKEDHPDNNNPEMNCPSCGHQIQLQDKGGIHDLPGLPAGVKFDPTDQEILEHLEAKVAYDTHKLHPLIDEFIPTLEGENGICYTHPEKLPGVSKDGLIRHFFHRPSKAYTTGTRKRRKVHTDAEGGETRWHKTGKTRPVFVAGAAKGYKKILVLYTNYGRQRKPEKTNWVMHQYHLGNNEEEKEGELVISKVFYQTQPRQCGSILKDVPAAMEGGAKPARNNNNRIGHRNNNINHNLVEFYSNPASYIGYGGGDGGGNIRDSSSSGQLIPSLVVHQGDGTSFIRLATASASKGKILERK